MKKVLSICAGLAAAAGVSAASPADRDALSKFDRTGEKSNCVNMASTSITAVDEHTLLFRVGPGDFYVNETSGRCNDADSPFTRIEVTLYGSQLCKGEIVKLVDQNSGMFKGACALGVFEKLVRKPPSNDPR